MPDSNNQPADGDLIRSAPVTCYSHGKKPKRRFVVLFFGKLEFYDSEKKFRQPHRQPKLILDLETVLNVNRKSADPKVSNAVALFTRQECTVLGFETEDEKDVWIELLREQLSELRRSGSPGSPDNQPESLMNFEYIWDVNVVKKEGLVSAPHLSGWQRLCLAPVGLFLFRSGATDPVHNDSDMHTFPWICVRNYGIEKGDKIRIQAGRQAPTGEGEVWMQAEAPLVAQSIHSWIKQYRQYSPSILEESRERSESVSADQRRPQWTSRQRDRSGSSLQPVSRARALSESEKKLQSVCMAAISHSVPAEKPKMMKQSSVGAPVGLGKRIRTLSGGLGLLPSPPSPPIRKASAPSRKPSDPGAGWHGTSVATKGGSIRSRLSEMQAQRIHGGTSAETLHSGGSLSARYSQQHSPFVWVPPGQSPLLSSPGNLSAESMSGGSSEELHTAHGRLPTRHYGRTPSVELVNPPTIAEEAVDYLVMQGDVGRSGDSAPAQEGESSGETVTLCKAASEVAAGVRGLSVDVADLGVGEYVDMFSPSGRFSTDGGRTASNATDSKDSAYMEMSSPRGTRQTSWNLEEVKSYISDSDRDSCYSSCGGSGVASHHIPQTRAYSLGSRPPITCLINPPDTAESSMAAPLEENPSPSGIQGPGVTGLGPDLATEDRKRAHSVGSKWPPNIMPSFRKISLGANIQPSDSSDFSRGRSDSFGSGRSTPLSKRLLTDFGRGRSLGAHSEDLVEVDFGPSPPIGRSSSGSFGSSESLSRSRTSSFGHHTWSPRVEQIAEDKTAIVVHHMEKMSLSGSSSVPGMRALVENAQAVTPSQKLIAQYIQLQDEHNQKETEKGNTVEYCGGKISLDTSEDDYSMMTPKASTGDDSQLTLIGLTGEQQDDYACMAPSTPRDSVFRTSVEDTERKEGKKSEDKKEKKNSEQLDYVNLDLAEGRKCAEPTPLTISVSNEVEIVEEIEDPQESKGKTGKSPKEKMSPFSKLLSKSPFKFMSGKEGGSQRTSPTDRSGSRERDRNRSETERSTPRLAARDVGRKRHSSTGHRPELGTGSVPSEPHTVHSQLSAPGGSGTGLLMPMPEGRRVERRSMTDVTGSPCFRVSTDSGSRKFSPAEKFVAESLGAAKSPEELEYASLELHGKKSSSSASSGEQQRKESEGDDVVYAQIDTSKSMGVKMART